MTRNDAGHRATIASVLLARTATNGGPAAGVAGALGAVALTLLACIGPERPTETQGDGGAEAQAEGGADAGTPDGGGADATADAGCPPNVEGLVAWLDSSSVESSGGIVTKWRDTSGHQLDLTPGSSAPTLRKAAVGGLDAVVFDGQAQYMWASNDTALAWSTDDFLVVEVAAWTNGPDAAGLLFSHQESQPPYWGPSLFASTPAPAAAAAGLYGQIRQPLCTPTCDTAGGTGVADAALADGQYRVVAMRRTGTPRRLNHGS